MKHATKRFALLLAIMMIIATMAVLPGCGSNNTASTTPSANPDSSAAGSQESYPQFNIWMGFEKMSPEVTQVQTILKEKLGFDFTVQSIQGDLMTALNLKLNSGGFEDVAVIYRDPVAINAFIKSGLVMDVSQYLNMPDKYPNLAKIPQKVVDYAKSSDGKLWYFPTWYAQEMEDPWPGWTASAWWYREDILEKLGMTANDISTIEGFERYLTEASKLTDETGKQLIPMGFCINEGNILNGEENVILSAFGVDMSSWVHKVGSSWVYTYEDPNFKKAYSWMNQMYRKGLIDIEVPTQKPERFREKVNAGRYAAMAGSIWKAELNNSWTKLSGPTDTTWYWKPMKSPSVKGTTPAPIQYVNPYPGSCVFISANTKNLDSILRFMDWCLEPDPIRQQEINEGPIGVNWKWTGESLGEWTFEPSYAAERNSGDQARVDACTPQLWMMTTYSKKWYPWWTNAMEADSPIGASFANKYTSEIASNFGLVRVIHSYDLITPPSGGVIEKYQPTVNAVYIEYRAKMIMAKTDEEFDAAYNEFINLLETRGHWSDMKKEWHAEYEKYIQANGEI